LPRGGGAFIILATLASQSAGAAPPPPTEALPASENITMTDQERLELEAAAFRSLLQHLRSRPDVQNIDMMNLTGFCRNCLSKWYKAAADDIGIALTPDQARTEIYGMPYSEWKSKYQKEASAEQQAAFTKASDKGPKA
jgi:hypothetical protein